MNEFEETRIPLPHEAAPEQPDLLHKRYRVPMEDAISEESALLRLHLEVRQQAHRITKCLSDAHSTLHEI